MTRTEFEDDLATRLHHLASSAPTEPTRSFANRPQQRRARRGVAVGVAAVVAALVLVGGLWISTADDHASTKVVVTSPPNPTPAPTIAPDPTPVTEGLAPDTAARLPTSPLAGRIAPAAVWTGHEMIVWSGSSLEPDAQGSVREVPLRDGAAFDPRANTWRRIGRAPIDPRDYAAVVWTGREMVVWGGSSNGHTLDDGAAYNPTSNRWRTISNAPIPGAMKSAVVWTGREMLITGGLNRDGTSAAYDPATDRWRRTTPAPGALLAPYPTAVWDGTEAVHILTTAGGLAVPRGQHLWAYQPDRDAWQDLGPLPGDSSVGRQLVWTGDAVVGVTQSVGTSQIVYRPSTGKISELPGPPTGTPAVMATAVVWSGREALLWGGGSVGTAFDPTTAAWRTFPAGDITGRVDGSVVWADGVLLAWGGYVFDGGNGLPIGADDGAIYRPPT